VDVAVAQASQLNAFAPVLNNSLTSLLKDMTRKVSAALNQLGVRHFLYGGAMLGHVIYNDLLPWDDDVDIVCFDKFNIVQLSRLIRPYAICHGEIPKIFNPKLPLFRVQGHIFSVPFIDLAQIAEVGDQCIHHSVYGGDDVYPKDVILPLKKSRFAYVPRDAETACKIKFGNECFTSAVPPIFSHKEWRWTEFGNERVPMADIEARHKFATYLHLFL
jgi:hypothetical protein